MVRPLRFLPQWPSHRFGGEQPTSEETSWVAPTYTSVHHVLVFFVYVRRHEDRTWALLPYVMIKRRAGARAPTPLKEGFQERVPATFISRSMRSPAVTEEVRMAATTSNTSAQKTAAAASVNPIAA